MMARTSGRGFFADNGEWPKTTFTYRAKNTSFWSEYQTNSSSTWPNERQIEALCGPSLGRNRNLMRCGGRAAYRDRCKCPNQVFVRS
jgi:hypothetical protein